VGGFFFEIRFERGEGQADIEQSGDEHVAAHAADQITVSYLHVSCTVSPLLVDAQPCREEWSVVSSQLSEKISGDFN
jgi:hypothetical protein